MPTIEVIYNGRDNTADLLLKADGVAQSLSTVTRMILALRGGNALVDSSVVAGAFDWNTGTTGKVVLDLGGAQIPAGSYPCRLIVYDPGNTDGIVWGDVVLNVVDP